MEGSHYLDSDEMDFSENEDGQGDRSKNPRRSARLAAKRQQEEEHERQQLQQMMDMDQDENEGHHT